MKKKVNVIGGGWYGCHLALSLQSRGYDVKIFEKNNQLFTESSFHNQNRLHLGFHYPRSFKTRVQSKRGFRLFKSNYPDLIDPIDLSLYAISSRNSLLDFDTYKMIMTSTGLTFEDVSTCLPLVLSNIEGVIDCDEVVISASKAQKFFQSKLNSITNFNNKISKDDCFSMSSDGIFVIDCTWNKIFNKKNLYYEPTIMFKYENKQKIKFGLTIMDGELCSIFPFDSQRSTLSDVEHTPLGKYQNVKEAYKRINQISKEEIEDKLKFMHKKINTYLPSFSDYFSNPEPFFSIKTKPANNKTDDRFTILTNESKNVYSVFSGKIDTIFDMEFRILSFLQKENEINPSSF